MCYKIGFGILIVTGLREGSSPHVPLMREHGQATLCSEAMSPVEKGQESTHML